MISGNVEQIRALVDGAVEITAQPIELLDAGLTQREALLQVCDEAVVWRSPEGEPYASVPVRHHVEHYLVKSRAFRNWMLHRLASQFTHGGRPASANENAVREARAAVEAKAIIGGVVHRAALRAIEHHGAHYIDLGTPDWSAVKVDADGWRIVPQPPVPILRGKRAAPFANPDAGADFASLRQLLSHLDDDTFVLMVAWCLGALLPDGPYPVLVLGGEQGSGKSTLARLVQRITDPVHGDLLQPPGNDRDLIACARGNRVLSFDNLSGLSGELADSFCRLATGSEIGGRALFSDHDLATFSACRPLVMNGIPELAARGDLADRSIVLRLPRLPGRITERDWRGAVERTLPSCFAALLDVLSCGLARLDATPTPDIRMADFARFVIAAEPTLPWQPGSFIEALCRARQQASIALAEGDSVTTATRDFIEDHGREWEGLVSRLYDALCGKVNAKVQRPVDWPKNARWFGERLRRAAPTLRSLGVGFEERRTSSGTTVCLRPAGFLDTSATSATSASTETTKDSNGANVANVAAAHMPRPN